MDLFAQTFIKENAISLLNNKLRKPFAPCFCIHCKTCGVNLTSYTGVDFTNLYSGGFFIIVWCYLIHMREATPLCYIDTRRIGPMNPTRCYFNTAGREDNGIKLVTSPRRKKNAYYRFSCTSAKRHFRSLPVWPGSEGRKWDLLCSNMQLLNILQKYCAIIVSWF